MRSINILLLLLHWAYVKSYCSNIERLTLGYLLGTVVMTKKLKNGLVEQDPHVFMRMCAVS